MVKSESLMSPARIISIPLPYLIAIHSPSMFWNVFFTHKPKWLLVTVCDIVLLSGYLADLIGLIVLSLTQLYKPKDRCNI